jgi:hypothetical protein
MSEIEGKGPTVGAERARQRASFNRHESFRGEAALECGGPPREGFAVANLTPLSGATLTNGGEGLMSFGVFGGKFYDAAS